MTRDSDDDDTEGLRAVIVGPLADELDAEGRAKVIKAGRRGFKGRLEAGSGARGDPRDAPRPKSSAGVMQPVAASNRSLFVVVGC